ncbi:polysaccharide deacetylase family protein [Gaoshiqia sp. Z1-71]|uniref:polysaccharide deacetylase family protein n=1 Tax=Gaoshiqia hydrogeniformans TaxID=3290090 RepID=UPI003BF888C8
MITVFTTEITNRLRYIFELYFEELLQVELNLTTNRDVFEQAKGVRLNYSDQDFQSGQFNLKPHKLLFQKGLAYQNLSVVSCDENWCFFPASSDSFLSFDPFAAGFFLVSRYEEYLERQFGKHRKYPHRHSILYRNQLLQKPVVNQWAQMIARKIRERVPEFPARLPAFDFLTTIDVDHAWAFKNNCWRRRTGAALMTLLSGNYRRIKERFRVLYGKEKDPFDTYDYIRQVYAGRNEYLHFFFLLGKPGKYDGNISPENENLRQLVRELSKTYKLGIHPSYRSSRKKKELLREIETLEDITGKPVVASRQHFLKLELPATYRRLIKAGIQTDYTMGYPDCPGFRAGIASPFYFYDLKQETITSLRIVPFQVMDICLKDDLKLTPSQAGSEIEKIMLEIKKSGGSFISLWHNESLSDQGTWNGWRMVFEQMTELAIRLKE